MADAELRKLQRAYDQDPTEENLARLNAARIKTGLAILRDPLYVIDWARDYYTSLIKAPIPEDIAEEETLHDADFRLVFTKSSGAKQFPVRGSMSLEWTDDTPPVPSLSLEFGPLLPVFELFARFQIRYVVVDRAVVINRPRPAPQGWNLRRIYTEDTTIPNVFATSQEFLAFAKTNYLAEVEDRWRLLLDSRIGGPQTSQDDRPLVGRAFGRAFEDDLEKRAFKTIIEAAAAMYRSKQLLSPCALMKSVIQSTWFQRSLAKYVDSIERALRAKDLVFDSENSWIALVETGNQYVLQFEAGYNDTLDEDFDSSQPSGARYGDVDNLLREVDSVLINASKSDDDWGLSWEYEEEPDGEDFAILIKGEVPLTITILSLIVNYF